MATNLLGLAQYVQQQGDLGRQQGQQDSFNRLAGQAYTAAPAAQNALVGQMVGIDPKMGMAVGGALTSRNQAVQTDQAKKLGGAARYMAQALQSNNPAQVQGAWQAVRPYLSQLTGKDAPEQWDESMRPGLYQAIAATGGMPDVKGVVTSGGQTLINPHNGAVMYRNPYAPKLIPNVPMGQGTAAGVFDANTEELRPAVGGIPRSGQQGDSMQPFIDQANAAIRMGAPEDKVRAWLVEKARAAGLQPQAPGQGVPAGGDQAQSTTAPAQFGIGTPKPSAADRESFGAPQQVVGADGKPHLVQFGNRGGQREVGGYLKPEMTPAQAAKQAVQQAKAEQVKADAVDSYDQSISKIDELLQSPGIGMLGTYIGDVAGIFPHSDTADANKALDVVKNQILLNTITKLKSLSATGASGFGQLSNQEGEILKNSVASLDTKQSNESLIRNLRQIRSVLEQSRNNIAGKQVEFDSGQTQGAPASSGNFRSLWGG